MPTGSDYDCDSHCGFTWTRADIEDFVVRLGLEDFEEGSMVRYELLL